MTTLVVLALLGCGGGEGPTMAGTLEAPECGGGWQIENANVEVTDEAGTLVGIGTTGQDEEAGPGCTVSFTVIDLDRADFYRVQVGTHGGPSYRHEDLEEQDFEVDLTLGGGTYPIAFVEDWVSLCQEAYLYSERKCRCVVDKAERLYSLRDFRRMDGSFAPGLFGYEKWSAMENACD